MSAPDVVTELSRYGWTPGPWKKFDTRIYLKPADLGLRIVFLSDALEMNEILQARRVELGVPRHEFTDWYGDWP